ncbi:MAG: hypothetical protein AVDCRST_MAG90-930, partial [uncultured Microvirga sp.]
GASDGPSVSGGNEPPWGGGVCGYPMPRRGGGDRGGGAGRSGAGRDGGHRCRWRLARPHHRARSRCRCAGRDRDAPRLWTRRHERHRGRASERLRPAFSRRRRQRPAFIHPGPRRPDHRGPRGFRQRHACEGRAGARQPLASADRGRADGGAAPARSLRRSIHRHVPLPGDPPRGAGAARHARGDVRLEPRDAYARRGSRRAGDGGPGRPAAAGGRRLQGVRQPARLGTRRRRDRNDLHPLGPRPQAPGRERGGRRL